MEKTTFEKLAALNVNEHVERKGKFSYLSWSWAVDSLRKADPKATWTVCRFDGLPYLKTECGFFVEVAVTVDGITLSQIHPVLDSNNKSILVPNSFQINTSIQRCLVKAIALHGLGLYIYSGEDLPSSEEEAKTGPSSSITPTTGVWDGISEEEKRFLMDIAIEVIGNIESGDIATAVDVLEENKLDAEEKIALWTRFDSKQRSAMKREIEIRKEQKAA